MLALTIALALASADDAPTLDLQRPLTAMNRGELKREYARIEEARPGLGGPITMMAIGGGMIVYGAFFTLLSGGPDVLFRNGNAIGYVFVAMVMAGAALLVPGIWLIWNRKDERAELGQRMDQISERIDVLDRADARRRGRRDDAEVREGDGPSERLYVPPPPRGGDELPPQL